MVQGKGNKFGSVGQQKPGAPGNEGEAARNDPDNKSVVEPTKAPEEGDAPDDKKEPKGPTVKGKVRSGNSIFYTHKDGDVRRADEGDEIEMTQEEADVFDERGSVKLAR